MDSMEYLNVALSPVDVVLYWTTPPVVTNKVTPHAEFSAKLSTKSTDVLVPAMDNVPLRLADPLVIKYFMLTAYSFAKSTSIPVVVNVDVLSVSVALANAF